LSCHLFSSPPDKAVIVTMDERTQFVEVCKRIEEVVTYQINNFRTAFPFCCPKSDLRTTLKLFDMVKGGLSCDNSGNLEFQMIQFYMHNLHDNV